MQLGFLLFRFVRGCAMWWLARNILSVGIIWYGTMEFIKTCFHFPGGQCMVHLQVSG